MNFNVFWLASLACLPGLPPWLASLACLPGLPRRTVDGLSDARWIIGRNRAGDGIRNREHNRSHRTRQRGRGSSWPRW
jgi:hypothetical protein